VGRRESHDAAAFYRRFTAPTITSDDTVCHPRDRVRVDEVIHGDMRDLPEAVAANSVALVVTSPPYYSGKEYETAIGQGHVPASYTAYLRMLAGVLRACVEVLEPGGRMAVNVANLGRKPYRSLSADVIRILEDELGLLLRGEIVWQKARGAAGNCAWGSFQRPADPVIRDLTERVVVASKGRFDRAIDARTRAAQGYPSEATIFRDEFLEATVDVWELPPERATRVNHPAPFPVELPQRLIDLFTYRGDLILDPFIGSGSTAVAALRTERHFVGFDTDPAYVLAARNRIEGERRRLELEPPRERAVLPATKEAAPPGEDYRARAVREGRRVRELARWALEASGFAIVAENVRLDAGLDLAFVARDAAEGAWLFDVAGAFTATRSGLQRGDGIWKVVGKATVVQHTRRGARYVVLTTAKPPPRSAGNRALTSVTGPDPITKPIFDVISLCSPRELERLRWYGNGSGTLSPVATPEPPAR
jgi:site-specific DNA-methyltransferase (adenine-specific)